VDASLARLREQCVRLHVDRDTLPTGTLPELGGRAKRIDHFRLRNGKRFDLPVNGVFEIENGKIQRFSDYFNLPSFEGPSGLKL